MIVQNSLEFRIGNGKKPELNQTISIVEFFAPGPMLKPVLNKYRIEQKATKETK